MKTNYIFTIILGASLCFAPHFCFADAGQSKTNIKESPTKTEQSQSKDTTKVESLQQHNEANSDSNEIRVVYPTEAINYAVADNVVVRRNARPPVEEDEEEDESEFETPIGQVRKIRDLLINIREEQQSLCDLLKDFQGGSDRTDEILEAVEKIAFPVDRTDDILSVFEQRFEEMQTNLQNVTEQKTEENREFLKKELATAEENFNVKLDEKFVESETKNKEYIDEQILIIKTDLANSIESAIDSSFEKAFETASETFKEINYVPRQITFLTVIASVSMLAVIILIIVLVADKIQTRREKNRLRLKEEAKAELIAEAQAKQRQKAALSAQTAQTNANAGSAIES